MGYTSGRFDPRQERHQPATVLPWYGPQGLTALKYPFLESQGRHDRFGQLRGGQQILFGGHLLGDQHETLILLLYLADREDSEMYEHRPQAEGPPRNV